MLFFLLINVKMPTTVGILTFMSMKNFMPAELSMKIFFITSRLDFHLHVFFYSHLENFSGFLFIIRESEVARGVSIQLPVKIEFQRTILR